jgi:hypothetical protein
MFELQYSIIISLIVYIQSDKYQSLRLMNTITYAPLRNDGQLSHKKFHSIQSISSYYFKFNTNNIYPHVLILNILRLLFQLEALKSLYYVSIKSRFPNESSVCPLKSY